MGEEILNKIKDCDIHGDYVGCDQITTNIILFQDNEREFVVTHNADIKPVSYFTGRETELQDLRKRIEEGRKSVLVSGMGGIGKTHICRKLFEEYLNKHADNQDNSFQHIGYIEYNVDIDSSLLSCLKYKEQDKAEDNLEAAWKELEYLASDGRLLLFVDNVNVSRGDDPGLKRLMSIPGAIVLTSRRRVFSKEFEPYRIGFLNAEKCREIYEKIRFEDRGKRIERDEEPDLEYIINTLAARHTITVEFLAHLAWTKNWTVKKLREELESNGFQLEYRDEEDKLVNIQKSYETLYDLSVLTAAEQNILEAFSMFPYIPLDVETCNLWLLEDAGVSEGDDILNMLYRKGWLQYNVEMNGYSMHPVFARFIYEKCRPKWKEHNSLIVECQIDLQKQINGSIKNCQKIITFTESIAEKITEMEQFGLLDAIANLHNYIGNSEKSEKLYKRLLEIHRDCVNDECPETARLYKNLAQSYFDLGKYQDADKLLRESLRIFIDYYGEKHFSVAEVYRGLAIVYLSRGEDQQAERLLKESLMIFTNHFGEEHSAVADVYRGLAIVHIDRGEDNEAEVLVEKSLRIYKKCYGENHLQVARAYYNMALIYDVRGEYDSALDYCSKAYKIFVSYLGLYDQGSRDIYKSMKELYPLCSHKCDFKQWLKEKMKE